MQRVAYFAAFVSGRNFSFKSARWRDRMPILLRRKRSLPLSIRCCFSNLPPEDAEIVSRSRFNLATRKGADSA